MMTLLIATRNAHKVGEIRAILGDGFRFLTLNDFPGAPKVVEDAPTFAGNATKKAVELAKWVSEVRSPKPEVRSADPMSFNGACEVEVGVGKGGWTKTGPGEGMFILADDSGLEVDALNGAPGVHSARFAALDGEGQGNSSDAENNAKLLGILKDMPMEERTGRFRCVLALTPVMHAESRGTSPVCYADEFELQTELFEGACEGRIGFVPRGQGGFGYDPLFIPNGFEQSFAELGEEVKNRLSHRARALAALKHRLAA